MYGRSRPLGEVRRDHTVPPRAKGSVVSRRLVSVIAVAGFGGAAPVGAYDAEAWFGGAALLSARDFLNVGLGDAVPLVLVAGAGFGGGELLCARDFLNVGLGDARRLVLVIAGAGFGGYRDVPRLRFPESRAWPRDNFNEPGATRSLINSTSTK
jgi:hypothetical protein